MLIFFAVIGSTYKKPTNALGFVNLVSLNTCYLPCVRTAKVFINSRKLGYRGWAVCLVLLTALTLASCTKKQNDPTVGNSPATTTTSGTTGAKDTTTTDKPKAGKKATLSAQAKKLGVEPKGTECPANAAIKGNLNNKGKQIYHEAKAKGYKAVKPEICFADVATAKKAGFSAPGQEAK